MSSNTRGDSSIAAALRPSSEEKRAQRIEICCVETKDGVGDGYKVCVSPKPKKRKGKDFPSYEPPAERIFASKSDLISYLMKVL